MFVRFFTILSIPKMFWEWKLANLTTKRAQETYLLTYMSFIISFKYYPTHFSHWLLRNTLAVRIYCRWPEHYINLPLPTVFYYKKTFNYVLVLLCTNRYITSSIVVLLFNKIFLCIHLTVFFLTLPFPKIISTSRIVSHVPPPSAVITTGITLIFYRVISSFISNVSWLYFVGFFCSSCF